MSVTYRAVNGSQIPVNDLTVSRARDFALLVQSGATPHAEVVTCLRTDHETEIVILDVKPTIPQRVKVPIRRVERVSIEFLEDDSKFPDVRALREDFPRERVLHLNGGTPKDEAPSICLFVESWPDVRLRLTANELLFRLQNWLDDTATGKLHREDQPLEPAFLAKPTPLIFSSSLEQIASPDFRLSLGVMNSEAGSAFVELRNDRPFLNTTNRPFVISIVTDPHEHHIVNDPPRNILELHQQLEMVGVDLLREVQVKLLAKESQLGRYGFLILLIFLQRQRTSESQPEVELAAFLCTGSNPQAHGVAGILREIGVGVSQSDLNRNGSSVRVSYLTPLWDLTSNSAGNFSGNPVEDRTLLGIGAGALGSQVVLNAVRSGLTRWTIIDDDMLLPHNLVRHGLSGHWIGCSKADALASTANSLLATPTVNGQVFNVFSEPGKLAAAADHVQAIVDLSASIAVARHLTCDLDVKAPRCSAFVSPSGDDLVFLGEDCDRSMRLDSIEAQYYRAVASFPALDGHLLGGSVLGSCRNITSRVSQEAMGIHAGQAASLLRRWLDNGSSTAVVLRKSSESGDVRRVEIALAQPLLVGKLGEWNVLTDSAFLDSLYEKRRAELPNETGGVMLAHVDVQRKTLYVCHEIPAPPDSQQQPFVYIRGCTGLAEEYQRIRKATLNGLVYIGEWHSHPNGSPCQPSSEDLIAGAWLAEETYPTSLPGLMLIVGEREQTCWMLCTQSREEAISTLYFVNGTRI